MKALVAKEINSPSVTISVKNTDGEADSTAEILVQNQLDYIPKVSVIIPVYNAEDYLRECIDSVVNQTLKEIEIICVDDGSSDHSLDILKEYAARDNRITLIAQKNLYAGVARNAGLAVAEGEYLIFLDSDDFFDADMLKEMYDKAKDTASDIVICKAKQYINNTFKTMNWCVRDYLLNEKTLFSPSDDAVRNNLFSAIVGYPWNKLFQAKLIKDNELRFSSSHHHNDSSFVYTALALSKQIATMSNMFVTYRILEKSLCHNKELYVDCFTKSLDALFGNLKKHQLDDQFKHAYLNYLVDFCVYYLGRIKGKDNRRFVKEQMKRYNEMFHIEQLGSHYFTDKNAYFSFCNTMTVKNIIPIILSADDNYALYMYIAMVSILENAKDSTFCDFYLMIPSDFSARNEAMISSLKGKYHCDMHFIDMKNVFADIPMQIPHITSPTYYRLLAGELLPQEYDKCIYLDVDVCVCQDLSVLYNLDMGSNYIAGVVAPVYYYKEPYHCKRLDLPTMKQYVNAGVLLMNLKQIRQDNITARFVELVSKGYASQDQDVLNVACHGKIITLPPKFNTMACRLKTNNPKMYDLYTPAEVKEAITNPYIIHYLDKNKPWNSYNCFMGKYWWNIAKKTPYYISRSNIVKSYLFFLYYLLRLSLLKKKYIIKTAEKNIAVLTKMRIDIKNHGSAENNIIIHAGSAQIIQPRWFTNEQGVGQVVESSAMKLEFNISAVKSGNLVFGFRGSDQRYNNDRYPIWIDYRSIQIDGKEILPELVSTWHDKPFRYEMPVKDGQNVKVQIQQKYHPYNKEELRDIIIKLNSQADYTPSQLNGITRRVLHKIV